MYMLLLLHIDLVIVSMLASSKLYIQVTITSLSLVSLYLPVSEIVKCGCYCCFTGTTCTCTLFATVFTAITLVC